MKGILRTVADASRIVHRYVRSYFGILLDDNNRKPLARLHFNGRRYADRLRATVKFHEEAPDPV